MRRHCWCAVRRRARALDPARVARAVIDMGFPEDQVEIVDSVAEAVSVALLAATEDTEIVVTGSLYTVGAARTILVKDR